MEKPDRGILTKNAGKYKSALDAEEIAHIEAVTNPYMKAMGYSPTPSAGTNFGRFNNFSDLEAHLKLREPFNKPAYADLPQLERDQFESWSRLTAEMRRDRW